MSTITTKDGTKIFYMDWGAGRPIMFSHGWPLSADDWDPQMLFFLGKGFRVIAHDRRGHGRSTQTGGGHDMDHYADDLAALAAHLDLKRVVHVGQSTGGGEVVHYLARHGESRVAKAAIISGIAAAAMRFGSNWRSPSQSSSTSRSAPPISLDCTSINICGSSVTALVSTFPPTRRKTLRRSRPSCPRG
jgi:non-heme chloroperoxidase